MRGASYVVLGLLAFSPSLLTAAGDVPIPQVPCLDPRGCPDLVMDKAKLAIHTQGTETFGANSCDVQDGFIDAGQRQVLRFVYNTPNVGEGALILGAPRDHPEWYFFQPCHNHYHFREYADYRLWIPDGWVQWHLLRLQHPELTPEEVLDQHPELRDAFVAGRKLGFCIVDLYPALPTSLEVPVVPDPARFNSCSNNQGLGIGWADEYALQTSGQYIDVTDVPGGPYVLEVEVNAERLFAESDYANNRAFLPVAVVELL